MSTLKTAYNQAFMDGVEASIPKIAELLGRHYSLNAADSTKRAEELLLDAFTVHQDKLAFMPHGAGLGSMNVNMPVPNDYAGAPAPTSVAGTAAGIGGAGAIGYGVLQNTRAQGASNAIFNNLAERSQRGSLGANLSKKEIQGKAGDRMAKFLGRQNKNYTNAVANVSGMNPRSAAAEAQKQFLKGATGQRLTNMQNFLKHNALKGSAMRWGLGGLGLWGLSNLL